MRQENVSIRIEIPISYDQPDRNGVIYTKEAMREAISKIDSKNKPLPLLMKPGDYDSCIGIIEEVELYDSDFLDCAKLVLNGNVFAAGTCEFADIENNVVKSFEITSIGLGK